MRALRLVLLVAAAFLLLAPLAAVAPAEASPVRCAPGEVRDPVSGKCVIKITPPDPPSDPSPEPPGGGDPVPPPPPDPRCFETAHGTEVPCTLAHGWHWVQGMNYYARLLDPQPPHTDPVWEGHLDGAIYEIGIWMGNPRLDPGLFGWRWFPDPPWANPPDPRDLAEDATSEMSLRGIDIGIVPDDSPGSVGLLGLPTWMWADGPIEENMGPITRSASAGGYTVTATAVVDKVVWDMGDGTEVTCEGPGTVYMDVYQDSDSPTCGHRYQETGTYDVTATSHWVINWAGMGQSGTIEMQVESRTTVAIGEAQVLNQAP
ncbi:hypothetical protein [Ornithinimicrobium cavernae]|uniref:hypothetical protein n=1 Tax=Ornithinimicrobium cavernae TaxID=2666047 RepID=UPI000D6885FA|nr:hypothetical protein [Ornithinimicrobium cavernae]